MSEQRPTIVDIAKQLGLSHATVSRALHRKNSRQVSAATRERVIEVAQQLGYRPNYAGRALVAGKSKIVSYMTADGFSPYYSMVADGVARQANRRGYSVVLDCTSGPSGRPGPIADVKRPELLYSGVDGIIACDIATRQNDYAAEVRELRVPMVALGVRYAQGIGLMYSKAVDSMYPPEMDVVSVDLFTPSLHLVRHLIEQGCRRIAHLTDQAAIDSNEQRVAAYRQVMEEAGLEICWIPVESHRRSQARKAITQYVQNNPTPDAVFCVNDEAATGCYRGLCDLGLRVPEDVAVAGCDGIEETDYQHTPITTLVQPIEELCSLAWDILESRMDGDRGPVQRPVLPAKLTIRRSTLRQPTNPCNGSPHVP